MATVAGTVAVEALLEVKATVRPPLGAGPLIVTVPVDVSPELTSVGFMANPVMTGGVMVRVAVSETLPRVAVIVGVSAAATALVVTVALAVIAPAGTVTVAGTDALALFELRLTTVPPVGATTFRVTVAVEVEPPRTDVGERLMPVSATGVAVMVRYFVIGLPLKLAVMSAVVFEATAFVTIVKVAWVLFG